MLANRSMPSTHVIPVLAYPDVENAVQWLCSTFGFSLRWRAGDHRAQLNVGDGCIAIVKSSNVERGGHSIMVRIENVDMHCEMASQRGARILDTPNDFPYGERQYTVADLAGHLWTFSQTIADKSPEDWVSANL
jgi:uncharacterized glyoxalase superfamily protein PhnB